MKWGSFGLVHLITIAAAGLIILGMYFALRKASRRVQTIVLGILSFAGIAAIVYNLVAWKDPLAYLPLHLCSLNAMVLPIAVLTRNKTVSNLLLVWSLGALVAIVVNSHVQDMVLMDWPFIFYYFPHVLEFGIPILLFAFGHVKKDPKCIFSTIGITMVSYTLIHFVNLWINANTDVQVNYMFSVDPSMNPLTALFYQIIPYDYWYMFMAVPVVAAYLCIIYLPQFVAMARAKKAAKACV